MLKTLSDSNFAYSASLQSRLEVRIEERRDKCLVHLLEYLHDPKFLTENKLNAYDEYENKSNMYALAATLTQRLFGVA